MIARFPSSEKGQGVLVLLLIIVGVMVVGAMAGIAGWARSRVSGAETTSGNINMLQPDTYNEQKAFSDSQTNLNNSGANMNNGQAAINQAEAERIQRTIDEQEALMRAEACRLRNDCSVETFKQGMAAGEEQNGKKLLGWVFGIVISVLALFMLIRFR